MIINKGLNRVLSQTRYVTRQLSLLYYFNRHDNLKSTSARRVWSSQDNVSRWRCEIVKVTIQCRVRQEGRCCLKRRLQEWRWIC